MEIYNNHRRWLNLLTWLESHGMDTSPQRLLVESKDVAGETKSNCFEARRSLTSRSNFKLLVEAFLLHRHAK